MTTTVQTVTLTSNDRFGSEVPAKPFGELLRILPDAVRESIRMAFEGRSAASGKRPAWLSAASDIRFLGHSGKTDTVLRFEVPRLGDAAEIFYLRQEQWPERPSPEDTGFDLLADVIGDIGKRDAESDRFDRRLLRRVRQFRCGMNGAFQTLAFTGTRYTSGQPATLTRETIRAARELSLKTPRSRPCRVAGRLDMIRESTNAFAIRLGDGQEVRGTLASGGIGEVAELFGCEVLILGRAVFRPSGSLLRVDANDVIPAGEGDQFFTAIPLSQAGRYETPLAIREQRHKRGVSALFGQWPGEESEAEIERALREIR